MDKIIIADMGVEGGGVTIYGRQIEGLWSFWEEGSSMYLDENDDDVWRKWSSEPVTDLISLLPEKWWTMYPLEVHPDFVDPLRTEFDRHRGGRRNSQWKEIFEDPNRHPG